ncbi:Alpha/Beta hydrolase protein [Mycena rosella]|uniref:Alpha/Beta hydrolase protein n=1 Tax=Mycena rosella TaxID=1033263 RepID=A0AAD7C9K3_MYCRO|nr:Alpha/Beta hydrolase protein [Mycena rosella]
MAMRALAARSLSYLPLVAPLLVASYVLASLPIPSNRLPAATDPGLASLPLNSRAREVYPEDWTEGGAYVQLPIGRACRYWLAGPESGKKVVLLTPSLAFTELVPILVGAGYRVLLYDLYGRGYSDAPRGVPYDATLYVTQLALLMQHIQWERTRVVGFSMGGAIAAAFVATFPTLVEQEVVLIASAGASESPAPLTKLRHWPLVEKYMFRTILSRLSSNLRSEENPMQQMLRLQAAGLPGYAHAIVSSLHEGPITRMRWAFEARSWTGKRVLLVHGTRDVVVPPANWPRLKSFLESVAADRASPPRVELIEIPGAGHDLTWTHADEVGRTLVAFLDALVSDQ